jgi:hypothetical protein
MPISLPSCYSTAMASITHSGWPSARTATWVAGGDFFPKNQLLAYRMSVTASLRPPGLGLEEAETRPRLRRKVPPVGGATGVVVGHLAGDEQDRLRPGHLRHLRVRGRVVLARRGVTLDLEHVVSSLHGVSPAQPSHRRTSSECSSMNRAAESGSRPSTLTA